MNILAVDCCLKFTGTALMIDEAADFEQYDLARRQSSELPHMAERLMRKHNILWNSLDYVALTNGPGYFTGIRVGAAYASGLAYASGAKIIPVSSLDLLAHSSGLSGKILVLVYAGHGYVYASCSGCLDAGEYSHAQILSWLNDNPDAVIISDDPERTGLKEISIKTVKPDMISLCDIARKNINLAVSPMELKILYYRAPQGMN